MHPQIAPLSVAPNPFPLYVSVAVIILLMISVTFYLLLKFKKLRKPFAIAAVILLVVAISAYVVWSSVASIDYWIMPSSAYPAVGDNNLTVRCENNGHLSGTFSLKIRFTKATFSTKTSQPYELLDNRTALFTYTLQPGENHSTQVYFTIDSDATDFYVDLSFQQNGINFLIRSDRGGVSEVSYQKDEATGNFNERMYLPPP